MLVHSPVTILCKHHYAIFDDEIVKKIFTSLFFFFFSPRGEIIFYVFGYLHVYVLCLMPIHTPWRTPSLTRLLNYSEWLSPKIAAPSTRFISFVRRMWLPTFRREKSFLFFFFLVKSYFHSFVLINIVVNSVSIVCIFIID